MTKYEWEKELKSNLKRMPDAEVARVLDYYNELFADKEEAGMSEKEIVRKFGNPFDVAYRIFYDYRAGESAETAEESREPFPVPVIGQEKRDDGFAPSDPYFPPVSAEPKNDAPRKTGGASRVVAKMLFFLPYMIAMIVLWSLVVSFAAGGFGAAVGGVALIIAGFVHNFGTGITLAYAGGGIAACGVGILMLASTRYLVKSAVKLTQKYFYMGKYKTERRYR